jgi:hypothetical protein
MQGLPAVRGSHQRTSFGLENFDIKNVGFAKGGQVQLHCKSEFNSGMTRRFVAQDAISR